MHKVYIAHTYGRRHNLSEEECEANAYKSIEWGRKLIELGFNPFLPNNFHWVHKGWPYSPSEDFWLELVSSWLTLCDAVFVAEKPPWPNSGVDYEIELAGRFNIPVFYTLEELNEAFKEVS